MSQNTTPSAATRHAPATAPTAASPFLLALQGFTSHFPEAQKADVILLDVDRDGGRMRLYRSYDLDQYYLKAAPK